MKRTSSGLANVRLSLGVRERQPPDPTRPDTPAAGRNAATTPRKLNEFGELDKGVATLSDPVSEAFAREFQLSTVHTPVGDEFIDRAVAESLRLPARVWRELMAGMIATDPAIALSRSGIPALVLRGDKDAYTSLAETDALVALVGATRRKTYANTGHAVHWEQPTEFSRDVIAFVGETGKRSR